MKLPKKPKQPRVSSSLTTWENYQKRVSDWKKKLARIEADKRKKKSLIEKARRA
jgi:hypothetical protein